MKVLITSLSAGSGHVRAAEALLAAIQETSPDIETVHIDIADFVRPEFRRIYVDGYRIAVNHAPSLWGRFYDFWDTQAPGGTAVPLLTRTQRAFAAPFFAYLESFQPDLILTTHFLIPQLLGAAWRPAFPRPAVHTVITDYDVHRFWLSDAVSRYYVGHEAMAATLMHYGVPPSQVVVSGIPVHPCFLQAASPSKIFHDLGLDPCRPVILVLSGGLGMTELRKSVEGLLALPEALQIVTVAGKNAALRAQLEKCTPPPSIRLLNLGYVRNMHELLTISDLVVTKPGGLTVSECLAKKKLMLLVSPIPGQEEKNAEFLVARGAAVRAKTPEELPALAAQLLNNTLLRTQILAHAQICARPRAAYTIAQTLLRRRLLAA